MTGEPCGLDPTVPDECCPNGRDQPQDTTDVGSFWPRWNIAEFAFDQGRYWYFVIKDSYRDDSVVVHEVQFSGIDCDLD